MNNNYYINMSTSAEENIISVVIAQTSEEAKDQLKNSTQASGSIGWEIYSSAGLTPSGTLDINDWQAQSTSELSNTRKPDNVGSHLELQKQLAQLQIQRFNS